MSRFSGTGLHPNNERISVCTAQAVSSRYILGNVRPWFLDAIEPSCPSVGHNFLKGREVTLSCSYRSTGWSHNYWGEYGTRHESVRSWNRTFLFHLLHNFFFGTLISYFCKTRTTCFYTEIGSSRLITSVFYFTFRLPDDMALHCDYVIRKSLKWGSNLLSSPYTSR